MKNLFAAVRPLGGVVDGSGAACVARRALTHRMTHYGMFDDFRD
jgi:hypothetical protein